MNEQDRKMIGEMVETVLAAQHQELRQFKDEVIDRFDRAIGATEDNLQHKLDLVVEGQQLLAEQIGRMAVKMNGLEKSVTGIAVDLLAHRHDTEAHRGYQVRED